MVADMALRLSGRFKVMVAICPATSRISVVYINDLLSVYERSMSVFCANFSGHFENFPQPRRVDAWIGARLAKCCKDILGGDVAHQIVSGKGAAAKPRKRTVKAAAS